MSSERSGIDHMMKAMASVLSKAPMLTLPQAMHMAKISDSQSHNQAYLMWVCCYVTKKNKQEELDPVGEIVVLSSLIPAESLSSLFAESASITAAIFLCDEFVEPSSTEEEVRLTSGAKAKMVLNKKKC